MKNVLRKRLPRFLVRNIGIYAALACFIILAVCFSSSYIVGNNSAKKTYNDMVEDYYQEDGNFTLGEYASVNELGALLGDDVKISEQLYADLPVGNGSELRVFKNREEINKPVVKEGALPETDDQIALDILYAKAQKLEIGDEISVNDKTLTVCGLICLPDYVVSLKDTGDMLADRDVFGVAVISDGLFEGIDESNLTYNYVYRYNRHLDHDEINEKTADIVRALGTEYFLISHCTIADNTRANGVVSKIEMNINTARAFMLVSMVITAFLFVLISIHTFEEECSFVGVLIATGYKKGAILRHYLTIPTLVTLVSSGIGLVLALTVAYKMPTTSIYNYDSLPEMKLVIDPMIFVLMLGVPLVLVLLINSLAFVKKLNLTPLNLIRRDIKKESKARDAHEMKKLGFMNRFRVRTVLRSKGQYISLVIGVLLSGLLIMFGLGMRSSFDEYIETLPDSAIANYEYVLKMPPMGDISLPEGAERDTISSYEIEYKNRMLTINVLGICEDTKYLKEIDTSKLGEDEVIISDVMAEKLGINVGDRISIDNKLTLNKWEPKVVEIVDFKLGIYAFTSKDILNDKLDKDDSYYNVIFSDNEVKTIDDNYVSMLVTREKIADSAKQMKSLMASLIVMLTLVGIVCYVIVMFMLTKMVIEKNALNISLLKVFGYRNKEVNKLYLSMTEIMIIAAIVLFLPLQYFIMTRLWPNMLSSMSSFFYFRVTPGVLLSIILLGTATCLITNMIHVKHVRNIAMTEALKNRE
ncbi:MAG: ABC transporter permease [Eubacterium sp.]|nr:ABC transporter permease [Eubacterium sp.]